MKIHRVEQTARLIDFLRHALPNAKGTSLKQLLKFGSVSVNNAVARRHDHPLKPGDKVVIREDKTQRSESDFLRTFLRVVYEDDTLIVVTKPPDLLSISTETEQRQTMYHKVNQYLNAARAAKFNPKNKGGVTRKKKEAFIVHRLDKEVSGLMVFAKTPEAKEFLQKNWQRFSKKYYAVTDGIPEKVEGTIESYLKENKYLLVFASREPVPGAKPAVTRYKILKSGNGRALLDVTIDTGRKHQIRVHLKSIGCPIAGDEKYGTSAGERIALHAYWLAFEHPVTKKKLEFQSALPEYFEILLGRASSTPPTAGALPR